MHRLKALVLFIFFWSSLLTSYAQLPPILSLDDLADGVEEPVYILTDSAGTLTIDDLQQMDIPRRFRRQAPAEVLPTEAPITYWLAFRLQNGAGVAQQRLLDFEGWSYVDFYGEGDDGVSRRLRTGHLVPFNERAYQLADRILVPVELPGGGGMQCLIRLEASCAARSIPVNLQFRAHTPADIRSWEVTTTGLVFFFTGIFLVMFFYHLFIYFSTWDRDYIFYLLFLFELLYIPMHNFGYSVQYLQDYEGFTTFVHKLDVLYSFALGVTMLIFVNLFFKTRERMPWLWRLNLTVIALSVLALMPLLWDNVVTANTLIGNVSLAGIVVILAIAFRGWYKGYPSAGYFVAAQIFFIAGGLITVLAILKVIPASELTYASVPAGATLQNILLSFALANKLNVLREQNENSQRQIIRQLEENERLQTQVNRELEQKVHERTQELNQTNQRLQTANEKLTNTLALIVEERRKSDRLLLNILPQATAEELKEKGEAAPRNYELVSVLFADFAGFSRLAGRLSPSEIIEYLNLFFRAFDEIIDRHQVEKIKTIGDAYMCAGGVPLPNRTNPVDTVLAAIEMQAFVLEQEALIKERTGLDWKLRIGVHSGELVAGVVGAKKFAYDIWGDTVNVAARLEENSVPGRVNISAATYERVKDHFECSYRGEITAKNIGSIGMYFVDGIKN